MKSKIRFKKGLLKLSNSQKEFLQEYIQLLVGDYTEKDLEDGFTQFMDDMEHDSSDVLYFVGYMFATAVRLKKAELNIVDLGLDSNEDYEANYLDVDREYWGTENHITFYLSKPFKKRGFSIAINCDSEE